MIKLFHCKKCNRHYNEANARMNYRGAVRLSPDGSFWNIDESPVDEVAATDFLCPGEHHPMEIIELDKCPHEWRVVPNAWKPTRRCVLCNMDDEGEVIWND